MQADAGADSSGGSVMIKGTLTRKVSAWAMSMALILSLSLAPSRLM